MFRRIPRKNFNPLNGLVGAWCPSLGATGTRLVDRSGRNNDGTLTNMDAPTDWVVSGGAGALDFDGSNDYVNIVDSLALSALSNFTISFWANVTALPPASNSNRMWAITKGSSSNYEWESGINYFNGSFGKWVFTSYDLTGATERSIATVADAQVGVWQHVVFTQASKSTIPSAFYNGLLSNGTTRSTGTPTAGDGTAAVQIGRRADASNLTFNGQLDDIRIYNRALSPQEVQALYRGGRGYGLRPQRKSYVFTNSSVNLSRIQIKKPSRRATLEQGLVGAWCPSLGPTGTRLVDRSPYKNDGTLTSMDAATDWVASGGKLALDFDGSNDSVVCNNNVKLNLTNQYTISMFAWRNGAANFRNLFTKGSGDADDIELYNNNANQLVAVHNRGNAGSLAAAGFPIISDKTWTHIVVTYNSSLPATFTLDGRWKCFYNGVQQTCSSVSVGSLQAPLDTQNKIQIGAAEHSVFNPTKFWLGQIDDVRIWNRALTASEVNQLYLGGRGYGLRPQRSRTTKKTIYVDTPVPAKPLPTEDTAKTLKQGLVGAWIPSLGATGTRLEDKSTYRNHGTLTNMNPPSNWVASGGRLALDFDGSNDYVETGSTAIFSGKSNFSLSTWVARTGTIPNYGGIFLWSSSPTPSGTSRVAILCGGPGLGVSTDVALAVGNGANSFRHTTSTPLATLNAWRNLVFTFSSGTVQIYVDGVSQTLSGTSMPTSAPTATYLIKLATDTTTYTPIRMDDMRIYDRALTHQEIQALYMGGRGYGFRPNRTRYEIGTASVPTGFQASRYRRSQYLIGSGIQ